MTRDQGSLPSNPPLPNALRLRSDSAVTQECLFLCQGVNTAAYTGGSDSGMSSGSAMAPSSGRHLLQVRAPALFLIKC